MEGFKFGLLQPELRKLGAREIISNGQSRVKRFKSTLRRADSEVSHDYYVMMDLYAESGLQVLIVRRKLQITIEAG